MKKPGPIKAAILRWLGVPLGLDTGEFWQDWFAESSASEEAAVRLSAVWACVRLISQTVSTLPLRVYRKRSDGGRDVAKDHQLYYLLCNSPNAEMTPGRFMLTVVASIVLRGNAYIEKQLIGTRVVGLWPHAPQKVTVRRNSTGKLEYEVIENSKKRVIPESAMMHIRGFGLDGVVGLQPVLIGRDVFSAAQAANEAASGTFAGRLQTAGIFKVKDYLKADQREKLRTHINSFVNGENVRKAIILENGMEYQGVTISPEAAQLLETRNFSTEEICRWFGIAPFMVGFMDKASSWASSVEAQNLHFLTTCLRPLLDNIEQEISRCLIPQQERANVYAEFSVEGLLRADTKGRAEFYNMALRNGWMNRNEVRRRENEPAIDGGDLFTVEVNLTTLQRIADGTAQSQGAPA